MNTKGDIAISKIVGAIIAILVLVILAFLVGQKLGLFGETADSCETVGGTCKNACASGETASPVGTCTNETNKCCIKIGVSSNNNS
ncbi:hypothetical protein GF342_05055 [Candidatus Woesearchaeota archaeon]|nr:hypothetical protein [Candidatus Woesearchaeota archaeon]